MPHLEPWQLAQRQGQSLRHKVIMTENRIRQWYRHYDGQVYVSFSGGKDSTVLLHIVRSIYPEVPAVFSDTGLEYPEIREFVKRTPNTISVKPTMTFKKVLETYGYPVVSKLVSRQLSRLRNPSEKNVAVRNLYMTGIKRDGNKAMSYKMPKKWRYLIEAPFEISDRCCDVLKKRPLHKYERETGRKPIIGTMASDSRLRRKQYIQYGCNAFDQKQPKSMPLSFWTEENVWEYINTNKIPYSRIYDMGEERTGCIFCCFGAHMEKGSNRFQRMKKTHPKHWKYCMDNLGLREVLKFLNVPVE